MDSKFLIYAAIQLILFAIWVWYFIAKNKLFRKYTKNPFYDDDIQKEKYASSLSPEVIKVINNVGVLPYELDDVI